MGARSSLWHRYLGGGSRHRERQGEELLHREPSPGEQSRSPALETRLGPTPRSHGGTAPCELLARRMDAALGARPLPGHAPSQRGVTARGHGDEAVGWSGDIREQPEGMAQGLSPWEKWMMEAWREGLAWGWLHALHGLSQERVPLATGSPGVIYGCGGVLQSPSPAGSVLQRRVGRCR